MNCPDCGCKVYSGNCINCHEETFIYEQDSMNDVHVDFSPEFMEKVNEQAKLKAKNNKITHRT